jgi:hypothetical protein
MMRTQGLLASLVNRNETVPAAVIHQVGTPLVRQVSDPSPMLDMIRSSGAQGFLDQYSSPPPPLPKEAAALPAQDSASLKEILYSSGARGFLDISPALATPYRSPPKAEPEPISPPSSNPASPPVPSTSPDSADFLRSAMYNCGARGFLDLYNPAYSPEREDTVSPHEPLGNGGAVGFLGYLDPSTAATEDGVFQSINDVGQFPSRFTPFAELQLDYSSESSEEDEPSINLTPVSDITEFEAFYRQSRFRPYLDLTSMFSCESLHIEKTLHVEKPRTSIFTLPSGVEINEPVAIFTTELAPANPFQLLKHLKTANVIYMLNLLTQPLFAAPGDYCTDPALEAILMFLASFSRMFPPITLFDWLLANMEPSQHLIAVWLSFASFTPIHMTPEMSRALTNSRFSLLASDMSSALYSLQQNIEFLKQLPEIYPFPSILATPHPRSQTKLRALLKRDPEYVAAQIAGWSFYQYTYGTPIACWFDHEAIHNRHSGPFAPLFLLSAKLKMWCLLSILSMSDLNERIDCVKFFIILANELIRLRDYLSVGAFCEALTHPCISRLTSTFGGLPADVHGLHRWKLVQWERFQDQGHELASMNVFWVPSPTRLFDQLAAVPRSFAIPDDPSLFPIGYFMRLQQILTQSVWPLWYSASRMFYLPLSKSDPDLTKLLARCIILDISKKKCSFEGLLKLSRSRERHQAATHQITEEDFSTNFP